MRTATLILTGLGLVVLTGCAMARGPDGSIIVGAKLGVLIETAEQGLIAGAAMIPGIGPMISGALVTATAGGATVGGVSKMIVNKIEKRRRNSDMAREAAEKRVAELEPLLAACPHVHVVVTPDKRPTRHS